MSIGGKLFTPFKIGPVVLKNRAIRAAAFEGMCPGNTPSPELIEYHRQLASGGVAMTTVAYASVTKSGLSFPHQLLMAESAIPKLRKLTESVHAKGSACSIQIGHGGDMAKKSVSGLRPMGPSTRLNPYGPSISREMNDQDIKEVIKAFGKATQLAIESGFDAIEIHAGHGYLISQFLSPFTNHRKDKYGGSLINRTLFMREIIQKVKEVSENRLALLVKMNMSDGFKGGMDIEESIEVAKMLEQSGADALVLSGGFVSRSPMFIMRGAMPVKDLSKSLKNWFSIVSVKIFGNILMPEAPFKETYFLDEALKFRKVLNLPLVYVGGLISKEAIDKVLNHDFELVALARALIKDHDFINKIRNEDLLKSNCDTCNYCVATIYNRQISCIQNENINQTVK